MLVVLRIAAVYNLLAGACMLIFVHEGYKLLGLEKPALVMPVQLVGVLVAIFGLGYWLVARDPLTNRNILLLGLLSKSLGPALALYYVAVGKLPLGFILVLLVADLIYIPPFAIILRRLYRVAGEQRVVGRGQ
jgi:small multidrug resistance pump